MTSATSRPVAQFLVTCAVVSAGMAAAVTISAIAAERMLGSPTWSGLPMASSILGTALGSQLAGRLLERFPLRWVLAGQYGTALLGGLLAVFAVVSGQIVLLALGLAILGLGHGATQYVRYLAADLFPPARRALILSWVVWMAGLGAVFGPALLVPTGSAASSMGFPEVAGPYFAAVLAFTLAAAAYAVLLPRDLFADPDAMSPPDADAPQGAPRSTAWPNSARLALVAMVTGHVVMVFVMTMTPIHLTHHGQGLSAVGLVLSAHMAGMFLCAPVVGWLCSRFGAGKILVSGSLLLAIACLLAALSAGAISVDSAVGRGDLGDHIPMSLPLFLLGLGWNFGLVGGSTLLSNSLPPSLRIRGRGFADACVWTAAACSSLLSSLLFARIGFAQLSWVGVALALGLCGTLLVRRRDLLPVPAGPLGRSS